jgi:hypothetical protein
MSAVKDTFVVTACSLDHLKAVSGTDAKPVRTDLAMFFTEGPALVFLSRLPSSWARPAVEKRQTSVGALHFAHGGMVGK